ncbi:MAG: hypothetical protein K0Q72_1743, partial [Armatimonadetes bacterium]|nr:hypothetical protein [Armatimonadota bacterium]
MSSAYLERYIERVGLGEIWAKVQAGTRLSY